MDEVRCNAIPFPSLPSASRFRNVSKIAGKIAIFISPFYFIPQRMIFLKMATTLKSEKMRNAKWTPEIAKDIFKTLIEKKFILYEEAIDKYEEVAIHSLIEHNFLQLRHCPPIVLDINSKR